MPPLPGEERLLTLFADVHYYFQKPSNHPLRHRFDKTSYFYLYYNATRQTSRIEIANNPGTPEQDAVHGHIDRSRVTNSHKFPTRLSIEVDADEITSSPTSPVNKDLEEWRLFSGDVRDSSRQKLKVHTVDVYLWAEDDAKLAIGFLGKLLSPAQLDLDAPTRGRAAQGTAQQDNVSPVVKNLENIAVTDPAYQNGQTRDSQNQTQAIPVKLPPPPPPPNTSQSRLSARSQTSSVITETVPKATSQSSTPAKPEASFTPMAYNPAAPAAPEPIAHRQKTPPPPEDGSGGNVLQQAAHGHESGTNQGGGGYQHQYSHYGSPPPPPPPMSTTPGYTTSASSLGHASPPPQSHQMRSSTASTGLSFAPPPSGLSQADNSARKHSSAAETYTPEQSGHGQGEAETPNEQFYNSLPHERRPLQHLQPRYQAEYFHPTGSAAYPQQSQSPPQNDYDIHSSVYRPTETESNSHHHRPSKPSQHKQDTGSLKGFAKRFTTGVNKTIQKAESKYL